MSKMAFKLSVSKLATSCSCDKFPIRVAFYQTDNSQASEASNLNLDSLVSDSGIHLKPLYNKTPDMFAKPRKMVKSLALVCLIAMTTTTIVFESECLVRHQRRADVVIPAVATDGSSQLQAAGIQSG